MKIDANEFMRGKRRKPTVCYPDGIAKKRLKLWGYYIENTNYFNVVYTQEASGESPGNPFVREMGGTSPMLLGYFYPERPHPAEGESESCRLVGYYEGEQVVFEWEGKRCELDPVRLKIDIFSRNTGILESDIMLKKGALIIGCGSVGSLVALELARAGVGRFFLIDMDIMGYHNICRHQCGVQDVGKYKVDAVRERILQINPSAQVRTSTCMIQEVALDELEQFCGPDAIIVGCADNREGDLYADSMLGKPYKMPFVSIGFWERAFAGEIFYCLPEGMPAYSDFMAALGDTSGRVNANTHLYMGEVGSFEPGISADINFVTTIGVKLILDLLNRDNPGYTQRLRHHLSQYTLVCNTNDPKIGGEMAEIFSYPLQVTTSIEVEYADKNENQGR